MEADGGCLDSQGKGLSHAEAVQIHLTSQHEVEDFQCPIKRDDRTSPEEYLH